ncbi:glycosyltransferase family 4 protein [Desulfotignum phosphitoxidans]|jgi:phosphatidylinositol alpha-1,6-mannosyltransferase|uniref:GDP-mannose-dependent alpha-(1-6)-phosphatidylinositol monomannoside mannosyltransferase PimB n=1 Tax=Desulfotignum phosphitoxidans DSM 13687 TaxID=1286635 RepID=S0FW43_9BACT|nr:glycosyltransferase family 4 protein [Desulfotignum phosphitoxidans]EMS79278.1 GDP-mannose-dependent alpha-(1-6)-phosphatidylinositol monomannoside mannosyltransferase PimB [Desulfotignum phosphitoxidans DSM 13687]
MDIIITQDFFPEIGGAHKWLYEVYKRWPTPVTALVQDYSFDLLLGEKQNIFDSKDHGELCIVRYDLKIENIDFFDFQFIKKLWQIYKKLKAYAADDTIRIHCLRAFPEAIPAVLLKKTSPKKISVITYAHGEEILTAQTSRQLSLAARWVYQNSDQVIVNSQSTKNLLRSFSPSGPVACIHPGVDANAFDMKKSRLKKFRATFDWPEDTVILCTMARMEPRKNHLKVIESVDVLRKQGVNVAYIVGSDGEEKSRLKKRVKDLNLDRFVHFTGHVTEEERIAVFLISDIHVMPSVQAGSMIEGFGIVFIEAAAAGIPSIAGNTGGQQEAVQDGKTGLVVDGNNFSELKDAIKFLIKNEQIRRKMGESGKIWAQKNDWYQIAKQTYETISRLENTGVCQ